MFSWNRTHVHFFLAFLPRKLRHENSDVKWIAAVALRQIESEQAVNVFISTLKEDIDVESNAVWALGQIGNDEAIDALIAVLKDENNDLKGKVAEALGQTGTDITVSTLSYAQGWG